MIDGRFFRVGAAVFLLSAATAGAQSLSEVRSPAELPPPGYDGRQYVDSEGCVFVRAGVGGNVEWVPRVDRQRKVLCGYTPTLPGRVAQRPAPAPAAAPSAAQSRTPPAAATAVAPARLAAPSPPPAAEIPESDYAALARTCEAIAPGGERFVTIGSRRYELRCGPQAVHPADLARASAAEAPRGAVVVLAAGRPATYCESPGVNPASGRLRVRCGPQSVHPGDLARGERSVAVARGHTAPRSPLPGTGPDVIPEGYQSAYEPGRLNPYRGIGTPEGEAAMNRRWTQTVPRREISEPRQRVVAVHPARQHAGAVYRSSRGPTP